MYTAVLFASVAVDLVLLAAEDGRAAQDAVGHGVVELGPAGAAQALTHVRDDVGDGDEAAAAAAGGLGAGSGSAGGAAAAGLLVVELQVLQALRQCQLLLDGHPQQRVEGLLLVLGGGQLPLHLIQLGDVLVAAAETDRGGVNKEG